MVLIRSTLTHILTTYRALAEDTVDEVLRGLGTERTCRTAKLALQGAGGPPPSTTGGWASRCGTTWSPATGRGRELLAMVADDPALGEPLVEGLP